MCLPLTFGKSLASPSSLLLLGWDGKMEWIVQNGARTDLLWGRPQDRKRGRGGGPTLNPFLLLGPVGEYQRCGARRTELPIFKTVFIVVWPSFIQSRKLGESRSLHGDLLFFLLLPWFSPWLLLGFGSPFFALLQEKNRTLCRPPPPPPPPHERSKGEFLGQNPSFPPSFLLPTSASKKRISGKRKAGEQKRAACVCSGHLLWWVRSLTT